MEDGGGGGIIAMLFGLIWLALLVAGIVAFWKIFTKAGKPGWASLIPIYNTVVLLEIVGRPIWWIVLMLIPFVNFVVMIILLIDLAKSFGKSALVGLSVIVLIGALILGFGDAKYQGPAAASGS